MVESSYTDVGGSEFPIGLRVLAVDDDAVCLKLLETLLKQCGYKVAVTQHAVAALKLLREKKEKYDIVITDVQMPDVDGFKLLEIIGLEMDLPVIMLSDYSEVGTVMKGIQHGACDYMLKPARLQELKLIWKHVVKKTFKGRKEADNPGEKLGHVSRSEDDRTSRLPRKCNNQEKEKEEKASNSSDEDLSTKKRARLTWSKELHTKFLNAVQQLGLKKAGPRKILDVMNVPGLTRDNVASHLQKFRKAMEKNGIGMSQPYYGTAVSDRFSGCLPNSVLLSFSPQRPHGNYLEVFKVNGYQDNTGEILSHHGLHNVTSPFSQLPLNHYDNLRPEHISIPQDGQMRKLHCGYGSNSLVITYPTPESNDLIYGPLPSRPDQLHACMENSFQSPYLSDKDPLPSSVPQLGYALDQENLNILLNRKPDGMRGATSTELNPLLPMKHEQDMLGTYTGAGLDIGVGKLPSGACNEHLSASQDGIGDDFKGITSPELVNFLLEHAHADDLPHLNNFYSSEDLHTVLKQC